jgi:hemoglobin
MRLAALLTAALVSAACATAKSEAKPDPAPPAAAAPAAPADSKPKALYHRLGGKPAVEAVVDGLLQRALADERINYTWAGTHLPRVRQRLIELVCAGTGGGCTYTGRDMVTAHRGMGITGEQFGILVGHLVATLDELKVPKKEKGELLAVLGPMKGSIVEER